MINEKAKDKLIVALDYNNMEDAKRLIEIIGDNVSIYKVGLESYLNTEGKLIDYLHEKGKKVFLDLKFHDIENTVKMACESAIRKKVFMFNIHCSNGSKTMSEVAKMVKNSNSESLLIGVTILTNLGQEDIEEIFKSNLKLEELILNMANIAKNSNMNGVVCSPHESKIIKEKLGSVINENKNVEKNNDTDALARTLSIIPNFVLKFAVSTIMFLDKHGILPKAIIKASPFHTSAFLTNVASLGIDAIYHHLYDFGTTGIFLAMGKKKKSYIYDDDTFKEEKCISLAFVCDERICDGYYFANSVKLFNKYLKKPELLEENIEKVEDCK